MQSSMLLALVSALGLAGSSTASDWSLRLLADAAKTDGALCLDGSAPGYYIRPVQPPNCVLFHTALS